jgi:hypothetical protein
MFRQVRRQPHLAIKGTEIMNDKLQQIVKNS